MDEWTPVLALPNLDMRGTLECPYAAIVAPTDARVEKLRAAHPKLTTFLSKFSSQFREQVWPSLLLLRADAPPSYYTAEAVSAFRDILSLSVVPYARTTRLRFDRANGLAFTNTFQFYPWMLDKQFEDMILINPAQIHAHLLEEFKGQVLPGAIAGVDHVERHRRSACARTAQPVDRAVFREARGLEGQGSVPFPQHGERGRTYPALAASVFYDTGRSLALWVSAYEILAHPGGTGQSNFGTVSALLESVKWQDQKLAAATHTIPRRTPQQKQLATWVCRKVYDLRNDFLHGNDVDGKALLLNGKPSSISRRASTGSHSPASSIFHFNVAIPPADQTEAVARFVSQRREFTKFQSAYESAISAAV